jgi:DNA-binding NtrC family response regulator
VACVGPVLSLCVAADVIFLDDDEDLRDLFREAMSLFVHRSCLCVASFAELVQSRDAVLGAKLAVLDINLGPDGPSGIDAYRWLRTHGFDGRVAFLTGHASTHPLVAEAKRMDNVEVLEKPLPIATIIALAGGQPA